MADCLMRGDEAFLHRDFEKALSFYSDAVDANNDNADAFRKRGNCHFEMHNYADAADDAASVLKRKPGETCGYILKGKCLTQLKRFEEAFDVYKHGLTIDPDDVGITQELARLQREIISHHDTTETIESSYNAVTLCSQDCYPGDDELMRQELKTMADRKLDELPTLTSRTPNLKLSTEEVLKADIEKAAGNLNGFLQSLTMALEYNMGDTSLLKERAEVLKKLGDFAEAFRTCNVIDKKKRSKNDWILGGRLLSELGLPVMAESWFRRATEMSSPVDTEAAILFQNVRVSRIYGPLTLATPVEVRFTQYGRAVFCQQPMIMKQVIFRDSPLVLAQTLDTQHIPACSFCATSLLCPDDVFEPSALTNDQDLKKALGLFWPKRQVFSCRKCKTQKYCSEACATKAWDNYHRVICPVVNPKVEKLHQVCVEYNDLKVGDSRVWKGWWNASFSPMLLARIWAAIVCEGKRLCSKAGRNKPNAADWAKAQAPYRRFIAYGHASNATMIPNMLSLMADIFKDIGEDGVTYHITEREFDGRYYQSSCNVQAFSDPNSPLKQFRDSITEKPRWQKLLKYLPRKLPEAEFAGLFPLHACMNHSCANNAEVLDGVKDGVPGVAVQARKVISPGEEICINYVDTRMPRRDRRAWLFRAYNFWCHCPRCEFEGDGPEVCTQCKRKCDEPGRKVFPVCSKCKKAWYCSQVCQKLAWKTGHKKICYSRLLSE
ncbi:potential protein lysine methyltransferase SET5-like [Gigantopelta aegis]|uniref:potential protein lysine methyltransferase SET5-like n=1 Tax=Gigantopelta aegis TaxID=1735272 RepID=UPI001B88CFD3|nr:potential protein lysine methyltransferase SET5-like [Gigantopelta aegis]